MTEMHSIPYEVVEYSPAEMLTRASDFRSELQRRRTVREFSSRAVAREVIEECLRAATSAPSGANLQPWHFVVVTDPETKHQIRVCAEREEHEFYTRRATPEWLDALAILGTDERKPFLEMAPYLIVILAQSYRILADGRKEKIITLLNQLGSPPGC